MADKHRSTLSWNLLTLTWRLPKFLQIPFQSRSSLYFVKLDEFLTSSIYIESDHCVPVCCTGAWSDGICIKTIWCAARKTFLIEDTGEGQATHKAKTNSRFHRGSKIWLDDSLLLQWSLCALPNKLLSTINRLQLTKKRRTRKKLFHPSTKVQWRPILSFGLAEALFICIRCKFESIQHPCFRISVITGPFESTHKYHELIRGNRKIPTGRISCWIWGIRVRVHWMLFGLVERPRKLGIQLLHSDF